MELWNTEAERRRKEKGDAGQKVWVSLGRRLAVERSANSASNQPSESATSTGLSVSDESVAPT